MLHLRLYASSQTQAFFRVIRHNTVLLLQEPVVSRPEGSPHSRPVLPRGSPRQGRSVHAVLRQRHRETEDQVQV